MKSDDWTDRRAIYRIKKREKALEENKRKRQAKIESRDWLKELSEDKEWSSRDLPSLQKKE